MSLIYDCAGLAGAEPQTWGTGLMNNIVFVGLNVHKATIAVAVTAEALKRPPFQIERNSPYGWRQHSLLHALMRVPGHRTIIE